jgi:4-amino-4-deoxy-L-arabinose transferase-like glycosyltransferase
MDRGEAVICLPQRKYGPEARDSIIIFLLGVLVFTLALTPEFIGFQSRFAMFAREMLRNGPSFFPTTYGHPYADYPAASVDLVYLVSLPFGRVTSFAAVLPSALASALILVLTYRIGALRCRRWGLAGALFALVTAQFLTDSRSTALDQYTSLATVLSFYLVYSADQLGRSRRLGLLPLVWIFGFIFRGPIGLVVPVAVVGGYYLWNARFQRLAIVAGVALVTLAVCVAGMLAAAQMQGGPPLVQRVLSSQLTGRINDRGRGFSYYWLRCFISYALSYPIAVLVVGSRFKAILRKGSEDDRLLGALAVWVLIVMLGMSIPSVKHTRYLLPIVPAISLIASRLVVEASFAGAMLGVRRTFERVCRRLPLPVAAAVGGLFLLKYAAALPWEAHYVAAIVTLVLLAGVSRKLETSWSDRAIHSLGICAAVIIIVIVGVTDPISYSLERTEPLVKQVETLQKDRPGELVFFRIGPDQEDIKFVVNMSHPTKPRFTESFEELKDLVSPHYIIAEEEVFQSLPPDIETLTRPLLRGRIGHENIVVFSIEPPRAG